MTKILNATYWSKPITPTPASTPEASLSEALAGQAKALAELAEALRQVRVTLFGEL
jgi:hypothetical protein